MNALTRLESALRDHDRQPRGNAALCPAHDDHNRSLSFNNGDGKVKIHCHAGCAPEDVAAALGLTMADLFDQPKNGQQRRLAAEYKYVGHDGTLLFTKIRYEPKEFSCRRADGAWTLSNTPRVLYRLPGLLAAVRDGKPVYVVEGEKDADRLNARGLDATCNFDGAGKWKPEYGDVLRGAHVTIVADRDPAGYAHARAIRDDLIGKAASVRVVEAAAGKDTADHLDAGHTVDQLVPINLDDQADDEPAAAELAPTTYADEFAEDPELRQEVVTQLRRKRAREILAELEEVKHPRPAPDAGTLAELLVRPTDVRWRVDGLIPASGRALVSAQRKIGKTTLVGNLARSLLTGAPFLDRFEVNKLDGRLVVLNYEVSGAQFARWMDDIGVPEHRLYVINLRGRRNLLADQAGRDQLADMIRAAEGEMLAVDPFGRAFTGRSQNDAAEVTPWLVRLDDLAEQAGATELVLTVHAGWDGERTRGSSALEDWPDAILTMTRDQDTDQRFIRAEGRDVDLTEDRLTYESATRRLALTGEGNRKQVRASAHLEKLAEAVANIVTEQPGINVAGLRAALRERDEHLQREDASRASKLAEQRGWVRCEPGAKNSRLHFPGSDQPVVPSSPEQSRGPLVSRPDPSYRGGTTNSTTPPPSRPEEEGEAWSS